MKKLPPRNTVELLTKLKLCAKSYIGRDSHIVSLCGCLKFMLNESIITPDNALTLSNLLFTDKSIKRWSKSGNFWEPDLLKPRVEWIDKEIQKVDNSLSYYFSYNKKGKSK